MSTEFTFTRNDRGEVVDALKEIMLTPLGETYKRDFYTSETGDADCDKILDAAEMLAGCPNITVRHMERALRLLIEAGEIRQREPEEAEELVEPEEDTRPRDRNGKLLSQSQIAWSEMTRYAETHSVDDCRKRARTDAQFASFMRTNMTREMSGGVGDAVVPIGTATSPVAPTPELTDFVRKYQVEPTQNLKPRNGTVLLAGEQIAYNRFIDLVNRATQCGLL